jgi:hypothetical protein
MEFKTPDIDSVWIPTERSVILNATTAAKLAEAAGGTKPRGMSLPGGVRPTLDVAARRARSNSLEGSSMNARSHPLALPSRADSKAFDDQELDETEEEKKNTARMMEGREDASARLKKDMESVWSPIRRAAAIRHSLYLSNAALSSSNASVPQSVSRSGIFAPSLVDEDYDEEAEIEAKEKEDNERIQSMIMLGARPVATKNRTIRSDEVKRGPSLKKWIHELVEWTDERAATTARSTRMLDGHFDLASDTKELGSSEDLSTNGEEVIDKDAASEMKSSRPSVMKKQALSRKQSEVGVCYWGRDASKETSKTSRTVVREVVPGHYLVCREEV